MRNVNLLKISVVAICLFLMVSCSNTDDSNVSGEDLSNEGICYITIEDYCSDKSVEIMSGDTVYHILKKSGADISEKNGGYGVYIEGINGKYEFDEGPASGWVYSVNDTKPNKSCSKCPVNDGDYIVWDYVDGM